MARDLRTGNVPKQCETGRGEGLAASVKLQQLVPAAASALLITVTTLALWAIHAELQPEHLIFGYLMPTTLIAVRYGSMIAMLASIGSSLCAAFFLYPPEFSFFIANPLNIVELSFFLILCLATTQFVGRLADGKQQKPGSSDGVSRAE